MTRLAPVALALYLLLCYRASLGSLGRASPLPAPLQRVAWLGHWRMFTELREAHHDLRAERWADGAWQPIDLLARYPRLGDDGPGYLRDDVYADPARRAALIGDLCTLPETAAIRLTLLRWPKTLGSTAQPVHSLQEQRLAEEVCR